jgi:phage shock protein PspC (stress-responsive transcriptional regulator)
MERKLYRSVKDKMIGGVASGLAEYFDIDPTIIRVLFVISLFLGGTGIIAYIVLWVVVPERPLAFNTEPVTGGSGEGTAAGEQAGNNDPFTAYQEKINRRKEKKSFIGGIILIALGIMFLADELFPRLSFEEFFSAGLIILGLILLINSTKKNQRPENEK